MATGQRQSHTETAQHAGPSSKAKAVSLAGNSARPADEPSLALLLGPAQLLVLAEAWLILPRACSLLQAPCRTCSQPNLAQPSKQLQAFGVHQTTSPYHTWLAADFAEVVNQQEGSAACI